MRQVIVIGQQRKNCILLRKTFDTMGLLASAGGKNIEKYSNGLKAKQQRLADFTEVLFFSG
jgi:hypothetical protein